VVTGIGVGFAVVLVVIAVVGLVLRRLDGPPQLHGLRCPACSLVQPPADLTRIAWLTCADCGYVLVNAGGKTGPAPGWARPATLRPPPNGPARDSRKAGGR